MNGRTSCENTTRIRSILAATLFPLALLPGCHQEKPLADESKPKTATKPLQEAKIPTIQQPREFDETLPDSSHRTDRESPEPGSYVSVTGLMGSGISLQNNLNLGWTYAPSTTVTPIESAFGKLILNDDLTYEMPKVKYSGAWAYDRVSKSVKFSGELSNVENACYVSRGCYVIVFKMEDSPLVYRKKAAKPIPDLQNPNGDLSGVIAYHDGSRNCYVDVASGKTVKRVNVARAGWGNANGDSVHVLRVNPMDDNEYYPEIQVFDKTGRRHSRMQGMTRNPKPWKNRLYFLGELNGAGELIVLNGFDVEPASLDRPKSRTEPLVTIVDLAGTETRRIATRGTFPATWVGDERILLPTDDNGIEIYNLQDGTREVVFSERVDDAIASPDGARILLRRRNSVKVLDLKSGEMQPVTNEGKALNLAGSNFASAKWSPDSDAILMCFQLADSSGYGFVILKLEGSEITPVEIIPLRDNQGDLIRGSRPLLNWGN